MKSKVQSSKILSKMDQNGDFASYPGITVVAACYPEVKEFCEEIYTALAGINLIQEYYSLLPAQSYHMTTMDLHTAEEEQRKGKKWDSFVQENLDQFKELAQQLSANSTKPVIESITVSSGWVIMLSLKLAGAQEEKIKTVAETLGKKSAVPKSFHITLAYSRPGKKFAIDIGKSINDEVIGKLTKIISQREFPMTLEEPKLCYFHDMRAFHPWNAEKNPFNEELHSKKHKGFLSCFFGSKKDTSSADDIPQHHNPKN
jgi:hypothetical protein